MSNSTHKENYKSDLAKSRFTPLLIELNCDDIKTLTSCDISQRGYSEVITLTKTVYNSHNKNNILVFDCDKNTGNDNFYILDVILSQLSGEIKNIKTIKTLKESLKAIANINAGGLLNDYLGKYLDKGLDFLFDEVSGEIASLLSETISSVDVSTAVTDALEGAIHEEVSENLGDSLAKIEKQSLSLSSESKAEIDKLSQLFASSESKDVFQLAFRLLLAVAIKQPKLLFISNPHKLDNDSIALLSLIFSFAKHLRDRDIHIGLSAVFAYNDTSFNLYGEVDESVKDKQQLLTILHRFTQRYAMLERPSSDIPTIAVKSSTFIGRDDELKRLNRYFENSKSSKFITVLGEPGVGKTALINTHLDQISKTHNPIMLSIVNEAGYSSLATGLSSLEKSIIDEEKRLTLTQTWKEKGFSSFKNLASKKTAFKAAGILMPGSDMLLNIVDAGLERYNADDAIRKVNDLGGQDFNHLEESDQEKLFDKLDRAIEALQNITLDDRYLILFIDDLQWIDERSSEYILTRLLKLPALYIIASMRPSDAATQVKLWRSQATSYTHSLAMFRAAQINDACEVESPIDISALDCHSIHLLGFDNDALTQLIEKTLKGTREQCRELAHAISQYLTSSDNECVNTLFAVETINMLCDDKLYTHNQVDRLVLSHPLSFNPEVKDITRTIAKTFAVLQKKHQASLSHVNDKSDGNRFNLMAYAVLEERLYLLKIYFGQRGNAAVNTLLMSSLLGAPFSSALVKKAIEALINSKEPELHTLRDHIVQGNKHTQLLPEHYDIIEEVYEILRRLDKRSDHYSFRHNLLGIFLDKQLEHLITSTGKAWDAFIATL